MSWGKGMMKERLKAKLIDRMKDIVVSSILFTVSSKFNNHLNLALIKHLVEEKGLSGLYVSLERPSYYVEKIFKANGIDLSKVVFLDAVQKVSGDNSLRNENDPTLVKNPFSRVMLETICDEANGLIRDQNIEFILVDSLTVMSCYVDDDSLISLLRSLREREGMTTLMLCDKECNDDLYAKVRQFFELEFNLKDDLSMVKVAIE